MRIVLADRGCILLCSMDVNFSGSKKRAICAAGNRSEVRECSACTHEGYFENRKYVQKSAYRRCIFLWHDNVGDSSR